MRKLAREEKPRLQVFTRPSRYMVQYIDNSGRFWRGIGDTHIAAYAALYRLLRKEGVGLSPNRYRRRLDPDMHIGMKDGPDISLGPSDYVEPVSPEKWRWMRKLFRI